MPPNDSDQPTEGPMPPPDPDPTNPPDLCRKDTHQASNLTEVSGPPSADQVAELVSSDCEEVFPTLPGYTIDGILGRGGMGVVYRARHLDLNRPVAIKMILGGKYTDPLAQARFLVEAEVIAALQHAHIVQVYEFGRHDQQPYFVLEFIGGGSLSDRIRKVRRFEHREASAMVEKLADAMATAHQKGVVHRDLKPANVLLTESGAPKITDFGLAKMGQSDRTAPGSVMGTPSYMSPEQAAGKTREIGTPADVYALGAILYELLTGRPPFRGDSAMDTIQLVLHQEPESPRTIDSRIPRDLETICLKCLEKDAKKRYATASELRADLQAYLAGLPISARPIGLFERGWKWAKRNPAWSTAIGVVCGLLILAVIVGQILREQVLLQQKAIHAAGLVQRLLDAETAQVPAIVEELSPYRPWADPLLREANQKEKATPRQKLHSGLALLSVDDSYADYLFGRLLAAAPHEVAVIRDALAPHRESYRERLWTTVELPERGQESQRLRAAAALAAYDPENARWTTIQTAVGNDLVAVPAVYLAVWMDSLRPVRVKLIPHLSAIYRDPERREIERTLATDILADYAAAAPSVLADLLMDGDEKQFSVLYPRLSDRRDAVLPLLTAELGRTPPADLPSADTNREKLALRQANAAVALLRLGQSEKVWPMLRHGPDPRVRSYLIHHLFPFGGHPDEVVRRLEAETDLSSRRALLLALGEFDEVAFPAEFRMALIPKVQQMYREDGDPGLHAASEWLLRRWHQLAWLAQTNAEWAKDRDGQKRRLEDIRKRFTTEKEKTPLQWYVNGQGQTMVWIPGPVSFKMGSPTTEAGRGDDESQHRRRIGRAFALADRPVTVEQYRRFDLEYAYPEKYAPDRTCPVVGPLWYQAAEYCNWLSAQEGIPEAERCYEIQEGEVKLKPRYLTLSGYRLPTEAEMEYATRAGATTARYYGETEKLLPNYAWYLKNSNERTWPVGTLKPNDFGLFDIQGNVFAWCQESYRPYPKGDEASEDAEDGEEVIPTQGRVLRGGAFGYPAAYLRSALRLNGVPTYRNYLNGFRPARTFP